MKKEDIETYEPEIKAILYSLAFGIPFAFISQYLGQILSKILLKSPIGTILYLVIIFAFYLAYIDLATIILIMIEINRPIEKPINGKDKS